MAMRTVGIVGGLGYMGGEALRILLEHPEFDVRWVTSRSQTRIGEAHRNLSDIEVPVIRPDAITPCDAYLLAVPSGGAMERTGELLKTGGVVIDLGSDFRLRSRADWERVYRKTHTAWELVESAVYGIAELHRSEIADARTIANPGCFATATILAMAPFAAAGIVDGSQIHVTGLSGTAGIGAEPDVASHHPEIGNNLVPYNVVEHRHTYEMEQELSLVADHSITVHFTPCYVPITRGILSVCHFTPSDPVTADSLKELIRDYYDGEFFVRVMDEPPAEATSWQWRPYPSVAMVSGTNFCDIGLDYDERRNRAVIFSVLDSMGKGGAHAAVQNLNIMFGFEERLGLTRRGMHPY